MGLVAKSETALCLRCSDCLQRSVEAADGQVQAQISNWQQYKPTSCNLVPRVVCLGKQTGRWGEVLIRRPISSIRPKSAWQRWPMTGGRRRGSTRIAARWHKSAPPAEGVALLTAMQIASMPFLCLTINIYELLLCEITCWK